MTADPASDIQILASDLALHDLFQQQTSVMLDRADLSEEQKQTGYPHRLELPLLRRGRIFVYGEAEAVRNCGLLLNRHADGLVPGIHVFDA